MSRSATHVTWTEIQRVLLYCERLRAQLGLSDWGVGIDVKPADDDAHANIESPSGKRFATLYLAQEWMNKPKLLKRRVLLHEMLHLTHQRQHHALESDVRDQTDITKDHADRIMSAYLRESEYMVDALATSLARLPGLMPPWPSKAEAVKANHRNCEP